MKRRGVRIAARSLGVAPHAGAWVETPVAEATPQGPVASPPTRGRGLKRLELVGYYRPRGVAPHAGAWVETC